VQVLFKVDGSEKMMVHSRDIGVAAKGLIFLEELGPHAVADATPLALDPLGCEFDQWRGKY